MKLKTKKIICGLELISQIILLALFFFAKGVGSYDSGDGTGVVVKSLFEPIMQLPGVCAVFSILFVLNLLLCILSLCSSKEKRESILHVIVPVLLFLFTYWYVALCGLWDEVAYSSLIYGASLAMIVFAFAKQFLGIKKKKEKIEDAK